MRRLILASQSPYRLELLRAAGFDAHPISEKIDESGRARETDLEAGLISLAQRKALTVWRRGAEGLIVAADTVGVAAGQVLGKPRDRADARRMLLAISGTRHEVLTGWCVLRTSDQLLFSGVDRTSIVMRPWTESEIDAYLASGEWQGKCGAYGLRLEGDPFVTSLEGSASNVIGLPMERLQPLLSRLIDGTL